MSRGGARNATLRAKRDLPWTGKLTVDRLLWEDEKEKILPVGQRMSAPV